MKTKKVIGYGCICLYHKLWVSLLFVLSSGISLQHEAHSYEKVQHHQILKSYEDMYICDLVKIN
jgi:hypothetical protein